MIPEWLVALLTHSVAAGVIASVLQHFINYVVAPKWRFLVSMGVTALVTAGIVGVTVWVGHGTWAMLLDPALIGSAWAVAQAALNTSRALSRPWSAIVAAIKRWMDDRAVTE